MNIGLIGGETEGGMRIVGRLSTIAVIVTTLTMAMARFVGVMLLVLLSVFFLEAQVSAMETQSHSNSMLYGQGKLQSYQCPSQCSRRCSQTQYRKPCMFYCQKCCKKCLCVPAGYYGNKASCPCYNNWKTKEGGPKCP
ncbi:hypothetical protein NE237_007198 [Protea cynaroides]|uniref:Uncharacterized protein n=1 Tax=Protea cynaroides TaxID=273540 RepID=A0A9Q0QW98_9MAGN|nr:hypothetical protein NE237_007198 [Protea cynaroides]